MLATLPEQQQNGSGILQHNIKFSTNLKLVSESSVAATCNHNSRRQAAATKCVDEVPSCLPDIVH